MYNPPQFTITDDAQIAALCAAHPLATLVTMSDTGLRADHIPLLQDGGDFIGHVALANDLHRVVTADTPALAVFRAAEGYVSPNWYPSKARDHKAVPTWNYQVVQVHGHLAFSHKNADKRRVVSRLTGVFERQTNGAQAWRMGDAPADYLQDMLDHIVAFRLRVTRLEAKFKLSQNRDAADIAGVIQGSEDSANPDLAQAMRALPRDPL